MRRGRYLVACALSLSAATAQAESSEQRAEWLRARVQCCLAAAERWGLPKRVMLAVAEMEGGRPGQRARNRNGTEDVGPMQFNTRYLNYLEKRYGIGAEDVARANCYAFELAAWRLSEHLVRDSGDLWSRLANYHSATPKHNKRYRAKLIRTSERWARWLERRTGETELRLSVYAEALEQQRAGAKLAPPLPPEKGDGVTASVLSRTARERRAHINEVQSRVVNKQSGHGSGWAMSVLRDIAKRENVRERRLKSAL